MNVYEWSFYLENKELVVYNTTGRNENIALQKALKQFDKQSPIRSVVLSGISSKK